MPPLLAALRQLLWKPRSLKSQRRALRSQQKAMQRLILLLMPMALLMQLELPLAKEKMLQVNARVRPASHRNVRSAGVVMRERNRAKRGNLMREKLRHAVLEGNLKESMPS